MGKRANERLPQTARQVSERTAETLLASSVSMMEFWSAALGHSPLAGGGRGRGRGLQHRADIHHDSSTGGTEAGERRQGGREGGSKVRHRADTHHDSSTEGTEPGREGGRQGEREGGKKDKFSRVILGKVRARFAQGTRKARSPTHPGRGPLYGQRTARRRSCGDRGRACQLVR